MADQSVIKEFLVAIGYKQDEASAKKFRDGVEAATKSVVMLGAAVEATAIAVAIGVARFASNLEALYFAAQRTGSSADQLQAYSLAMQNFGASAEDAMGAVENLATFFRKNPGGESFLGGWLKQVGIDFRNLHGEVEWAKALGKLFAFQRGHGQTAMAELIAGQVGISERSMLAMSAPGFDAELDKQLRLTKGWQAATEAAHRFEMALRQVERQLQQTLLPLESKLLLGEGGLIGKFSKFLQDHGAQIVKDINYVATGMLNFLGMVLDWFDKHGDELQKKIEMTFGAVGAAYTKVKPALDYMYDKFKQLDAATGGWLTTLGLVAIALKAIGAGGLVTSALGAAKWVLPSAAAATAGGAVAGVAGGVASMIPLVKAIMLGIGAGWFLDTLWPDNPLAKAGDWLGSFFADAMDQDKAKQWALRHPGVTPPTSGAYTGSYPWQKPTPSEGTTTNNIHVDTDINVSDASSEIMGNQNLARMIAKEQAKVSADFIREFSSAPR